MSDLPHRSPEQRAALRAELEREAAASRPCSSKVSGPLDFKKGRPSTQVPVIDEEAPLNGDASTGRFRQSGVIITGDSYEPVK